MISPYITNSSKAAPPFPVVGIGASKGGLNALKKIVSAIPEDSGIAYLIIQHSPNDNHENLTEILSNLAAIPLHEIVNDIKLTPNHIYVIPENNLVVAENGILKLKTRNRGERRNNSIDIFLEAIAEVHQSFAIGVVLSGSILDGAFGLKKIKESGGVTIAQKPETAAFKAMPQNAIDSDATDLILKPQDIPVQLKKIHQSYLLNKAYTNNQQILKDEDILHQIMNVVFLRSENDFRQYNPSSIRKSIARRMAANKSDTPEEYYNFLRNNKTEQDFLFDDLLNPVTYFFRDLRSLESLFKVALPQLIKNAHKDHIRIWVAGCSTGEETYSLAITIYDYLIQTNNLHITVQIFSSDLSEKSIAKARTAIYSQQDVQQVPTPQLQKYFARTEGNYHVNKVIREMCVFTTHNVAQDPPFSRIDLIACQNVLKYFNPSLQNKVLNIFHSALRDNGILLLGKSEMAFHDDKLFKKIDKQSPIYVRSLSSAASLPESFEPADPFFLASNEQEISSLNDELKDRQEQLLSVRNYADAIVKTIREPLLIIDRNFIFRSANPAFYNLFKINETQTEGQGFFEIENGQWDIPDLKEQILKIINEDSTITDFKIETQGAHTGQKTLLVNARRMDSFLSEGMIVMTFKDITDEEHTNFQLQEKINELQQHNEQLKCFTLAASEDLQEPLRKMHMFCKRVFENETQLSENGKYNLDRVLFSVNCMSHIIGDLIEFSKITFTDKEFKKTELNLILKKALSDLKNDIKQKGAVISSDPLPSLHAIPTQIQQLFSIIIENSLVFAKDEISPEIKIEVQQSTAEEINALGGLPDNGYVKIGITDNGTGFEKEYETRIFDPFYKIDRKGQCNGSGLGLTLAKKIVDNHNGFIKAHGRPNNGTAIYIYLPQ